MRPTIIARASPEFSQAAAAIISELVLSAEPSVRPLILNTRWYLQRHPTARQMAAIWPPPDGRPVLGLFTPPYHISLFEETIGARAEARGMAVPDVVREVAIHELAQHRFGLNHTRERDQLALDQPQATA